jgi:hypothetical protein
MGITGCECSPAFPLNYTQAKRIGIYVSLTYGWIIAELHGEAKKA